MPRLFAVIAMSLALISPAKSEETAKAWALICESSNLDFRGLCTTYIRGFVDGFRDGMFRPLIETNRKWAGLTFCIPDDVSADDLRKLVVRELHAIPAWADKPFGIIITLTMESYFPCQPGTDLPSRRAGYGR